MAPSPDHMLDLRDTQAAIERIAGLDTGWFGLAIQQWCEATAQAERLPFETYREERFNPQGQRIGPDLRISARSAVFMLSAGEKIAEALSQAAADYAREVAGH